MDYTSKRLGEIQTDLSAIKVDLSGIKAQMQHLATKSAVNDFKTSIIRWAVGGIFASAALAFAIAKFFH